ncbi:MAG: Nif3-like dinuclear metal center hexameric protein [Bacteroidota bacterium]
MKIEEVIKVIEQFAPPAYQESYDNTGLITGDSGTDVTGILICLDSTEEIIEEAIRKNCNLILAHHPIVFSGLKKISNENYIGRTIIKAIQNNIALYAAHTNLDNVQHGVNKKICEKLGLKNFKILSPKKSLLKKLVTFCPKDQADKVQAAIFSAGAGKIGNYDECSFNIDGTGTFRAGEGTDPFVGKISERHSENEVRIETIFETVYHSQIIRALLESHPYEEVAYDIYPLDNTYQNVGSGMIGDLEHETAEKDFLLLVKNKMQTDCIRHTKLTGKKVYKVAVCGGAGSFLLNDAIRQNAQFFISADFKYHQFFDADNKIVIADIGHYESEQFTKEIFYDLLKDIFPTFALHFAETVTNPVSYF